MISSSGVRIRQAHAKPIPAATRLGCPEACPENVVPRFEEVDFVLTDRRGPTHLIEVKWRDRPVDKALRYLHARFPDAAAFQISATGTDDHRTPDGIRVQPALPFLQSLV